MAKATRAIEIYKELKGIVLADWQNNNSLYNSVDFLESYKMSLEENKEVLLKDKKQVEKNLLYLEENKYEILKRKSS